MRAGPFRHPGMVTATALSPDGPPPGRGQRPDGSARAVGPGGGPVGGDAAARPAAAPGGLQRRRPPPGHGGREPHPACLGRGHGPAGDALADVPPSRSSRSALPPTATGWRCAPKAGAALGPRPGPPPRRRSWCGCRGCCPARCSTLAAEPSPLDALNLKDIWLGMHARYLKEPRPAVPVRFAADAGDSTMTPPRAPTTGSTLFADQASGAASARRWTPAPAG